MKAGFNNYWHDGSDINRMCSLLSNRVLAYCVVAGSSAQGPFSLTHAKSILNKYPRGETPPSRAVFEVRDGVVLQDPHHVGGENQGIALKAGFNRYWTGWDDINRMHAILQKRVQAHYVVAGNDSKGPFSLAHAKSILHTYTPGATVPSRAVFEVRNCIVLKDPHSVGGEKQGDGLEAGFNMYWHEWHDINRMHAMLDKHIQEYYVAIGNKAKGPFCLAHAKNILND